jgi:hypothetical protein
MLEASKSGSNLLFRMNGQLIVEASGHDHTGRRLSDDGREAPLTRKFCTAVLDSGTSVMSSDGFSATLANQPIYFEESIGLPILHSDGTLECIVLVHGLGRVPAKEK